MDKKCKTYDVSKGYSDFKDRFFIREEGRTDENFGTYPLNRDIKSYIRSGLVCIDKPKGPSSHEVANWVKQILEVGKAGHTGTLDPGVTGVLPVLIEGSTKLVKILQESSKEYITLMRLHGDADEGEIRHIIKMFKGKIYQRPPLKSAVKKVIRVREIYELEILEIEGRSILFRVVSEAGTYIRKLCIDIGEILGVGAHMQELRRTRTGVFDEDSCYTLHDLKDAYIVWKEEGNEEYLRKIIRPVEDSVKNLPKIFIKDSAVDALCHGANLTARGICYIEKNVMQGRKVAIFTLKGELVALGISLQSAKKLSRLRNGNAVNTLRVIMERGTYPSMWKRSEATLSWEAVKKNEC